MPELTAVFYGDSYTAGYGDRKGLGWVGRLSRGAARAGLDLTTYNLGVRGQTSEEIGARWRAELPGRDHGEVRLVFSFGANDVSLEDGAERVPLDRSVAVLEGILAEAAAMPAPALVVGPAPYGDAEQMDRVEALSRAYAETCAARGAGFIEVAAGLRGDEGWREQIERRDGAHPDAEGYAAFAEIVEAGGFYEWLRAPAGLPQTRD